jgi:hypothetical protein
MRPLSVWLYAAPLLTNKNIIFQNMLKLNFVSEKTKQEINIRRFYFLTKRVEIILILLALSIGGILLAAQFVLSGNYNSIDKKTAEVIRINSGDYNSEAKKINNELSVISKIQNEFVSSPTLLKAMTDIIPPGVSLNYLKADFNDKTVKLKGQAALRSDFLALKENLKKSEIFSGAVFPIQNIAQKEKINFDLNLKFNSAKLPNF